MPGHYRSESPMIMDRDYFVDDVLKDYRGQIVEPVSQDAEAPLFLMYTSGTTGKPKGCQHRTGGYLAYAAGTSKYYQDIHPEDVYWCMADIGWITGHSYIVYGPLALARHQRSLRRRAAIPRCRTSLAHCRASRRQYFSHFSHRHPHACAKPAATSRKNITITSNT